MCDDSAQFDDLRQNIAQAKDGKEGIRVDYFIDNVRCPRGRRRVIRGGHVGW